MTTVTIKCPDCKEWFLFDGLELDLDEETGLPACNKCVERYIKEM